MPTTTFVGTAKDDHIEHVDGSDQRYNLLYGKGGDDVLGSIYPGDVEMYGGAGRDYLSVSIPGSAIIYGGAGKDQIVVLAEASRVEGGGGNDRILVSAGVDVVRGGKGRDYIDAGAFGVRSEGGLAVVTGGVDQVYGGKGADVFVCRPEPAHYTVPEHGFNHIMDFQPGKDRLKFADLGLTLFDDPRDDEGFVVNGTEATAAIPTFIYDPESGDVFYDEDGTGRDGMNIAPVHIAKLEPGLHLGNGDILFSW